MCCMIDCYVLNWSEYLNYTVKCDGYMIGIREYSLKELFDGKYDIEVHESCD